MPFELGRTNIHIWLVRLASADSIVRQFQDVLVQEEIGRAERFKFRRLREHYILSRGSLRFLLARYLDVTPGDIRLRYGTRGKPHLSEQNGVKFNVSHSGDLAAFAFGFGDQIGIDVEQLRPVPDMEGIAEKFFSLDEHDELLALPQHQRAHAFFLCWTRKEAFIKAVGEGLHIPLNSFRVTLRPDRPVELTVLTGDRTTASRWKLHDLQVGAEYAGALAYSGTQRKVTVHSCIQASDLPAMCVSSLSMKRLA